MNSTNSSNKTSAFSKWFLHELHAHPSSHHKDNHKHPWWEVMCLTGVDYFSTLGYQPGIAFLAAGVLSPVATLVLVLVTLFAALPVYRKVAEQSYEGQGSISMLEKLFPRWRGKAIVLVLLGFAITDFIITITLSAADATAHIIENPFVPRWLDHKVLVTLFLISCLGGVFLKGFKEAISIAVVIVAIYLGLNLVVIYKGLSEVFIHPDLLSNWTSNLWQNHNGNPFLMLGIALLMFPKLALGLSGFETGVAVMPQIKAEETKQRIDGAKKLLLVSALIMSVMLIFSSIITTLLIPTHEFQTGGEANGRALAYLAHKFYGDVFGSIYDVSTISILGFAGASAMAGLLNLVPKYLPAYGMAPEWAKACRPLVLVFTAIAFVVTIIFNAEVDAQAGAYATGVLVLMTSASVAVLISVRKTKLSKFFFSVISIVFVYTTLINIYERPEGLKIALGFILLTVFISLVSRTMRSTELRISEVHLDASALQFLEEDQDKIIHIVAHRPGDGSLNEYNSKALSARELHHLENEQIIFIEIQRSDASDFDSSLNVRGVKVGKHKILRGSSPAIANAIAALLIEIGEITGKLPHAYFGWTEGTPMEFLFKLIFFGEGDVAPISLEVLRQKIPNPRKRPYIHVS